MIFGVEVLGLMPVCEPALVQGNGTEDLLGVSLAVGGDLQLRADRCPGLVKRGRLPEGGFVFVNDYRLFLPGFFLLGIGVTNPSVLLFRIGLGEFCRGTLQG